MQVINLEIPEAIWESHHRDIQAVKTDVQQGFVIWEYLNGHLGLRECAELLNLNYRNFLDLLWSRGIPIDGLSTEQVETQADALHQRLG
jgi:predicted HTH domain antitoxin